MRSRTAAIAAAVTWMSLIFLASSLPSSATGPNTPFWSFLLKVLHFTNYGVLSLLLLSAFKKDGLLADVKPGVFVLCFLLSAGYAVSDEYHQLFSPGRHPSARDILIDALGATVFLGITFVWTRKRGKRKIFPAKNFEEEK